MNPTEKLLAALKQNFSGTLADFKALAVKELNGTKFTALKYPDGRRVIIVVCFTGAHEISKAMKNIAAADIDECDFSRTELPAVSARAAVTGRFVCLCEGGKSNPATLVLISADPVSTTKVELLLGLKP